MKEECVNHTILDPMESPQWKLLNMSSLKSITYLEVY